MITIYQYKQLPVSLPC